MTQLSSSLRQICNSEEDVRFNFQKISRASMLYGIHDSLQLQHFLNPCNIRMLIFGTHLFKILPNYIPQQTIIFSCYLHETITKDVVLTNSSSRTMTYLVYLEAHKNFSIDSDVIKVESGRSVNVSITFNASLSRQLSGRIIFRNRKNGHSAGGALVFELKSQVLGRFSLSTHLVNHVK